jgi:organic radical activating enzyme
MEHFYTLQGEGKFAGQAAYFIRVGGCDVGCVWCDVKESWNANAHPQLSIEELIEEIQKTSAKMVVVTGGEPAMYDLTEWTKALKDAGFLTHIETSGAYPITGSWDWVTFSPKKFKTPLEEECRKADELKVIVFNASDFKWAEIYEKQVNEDCQLYLQPEWDKEKEMSPLIIGYIKQNPQWRISIQTHKYLNIP